ncbi:hypothetical protein [Streptomyces sp. NBC_00390]|uniref:hypothetical protein n=1 Tax=Streptomyces sp. NBC_00390 TaxID=2975736 RepID=UPI002E1D6A74
MRQPDRVSDRASDRVSDRVSDRASERVNETSTRRFFLRPFSVELSAIGSSSL